VVLPGITDRNPFWLVRVCVCQDITAQRCWTCWYPSTSCWPQTSTFCLVSGWRVRRTWRQVNGNSGCMSTTLATSSHSGVLTAMYVLSPCHFQNISLILQFIYLFIADDDEAGWQGSARNHHNVPDLSWQHGGSVLSLVRNTLILQCFDAVGWVTGRASGL